MKRGQLTNVEKETIIAWNNAEDTATVYTHDSRMKARLKQLATEYPDLIKLTRESQMDIGDVTYEVPKELITIRKPISEAKKQKARELALKNKWLPPWARDKQEGETQNDRTE